MGAADVMDSLVHTFLAILGAVAGITIGVSKEGAQLVASLTSASGRQALYSGSPRGPKKIDNGPYRPEPPKSLTAPGQEEIKQFLGTRPPELKQAPPVIRTYTDRPVLGGPPPSPPPTASPRRQTVSQPTQTGNALPAAVPAGTTNYPVLGEPLPDIFGAETSFITNRPLSPPPVQRSFEPAPAPGPLRTAQPVSPVNAASQPVTAAPVSPSAVGNAAVDSSTISCESPEVLTDDEAASVASETSPDGKQSTDSKIRKLRKRISSKLKIGKA